MLDRKLIAALALVALLPGCSTARKAVGAVSSIGNLFGGTKSAAQDEAQAGSETSATAGTKITRADDIKEASRRLPGGLVADTRNVLHSGDPIPPR